MSNNNSTQTATSYQSANNYRGGNRRYNNRPDRGTYNGTSRSEDLNVGAVNDTCITNGIADVSNNGKGQGKGQNNYRGNYQGQGFGQNNYRGNNQGSTPPGYANRQFHKKPYHDNQNGDSEGNSSDNSHMNYRSSTSNSTSDNGYQNNSHRSNNSGNYRGNYNGSRNNGYSNNDTDRHTNHRYNNGGNYNGNQRNDNRQQQQDDTDNSLLTNNEWKRELVEYVYRSLELSRFKFKIIENEEDLSLLKNTKYLSPNYNGINGLLVFKKINDKYFSCIIDRRSLAYNYKQIDINNVKITPINIRLSMSIYDGSIMDGVILYSNNNSNNNNGANRYQKTFVINDIYYLNGQNLIDDRISNKMINITQYMKQHYSQDKRLNNVEFLINTLFPMSDIKRLIDVDIPQSRHKSSIKGLSFYPELSSTKLIYLFNNGLSNKNLNDDEPYVNGVTKIGAKFSKRSEEEDVAYGSGNRNQNKDRDKGSVKEEQYVERKPNVPKNVPVRDPKIQVVDEIVAIFRLKKTDTVDVYSLHLCKKIDKDGKHFVKYKKFGMAYIPTKDCSYFCKDMFDNTDKDNVLVRCKYAEDKEKWIPYEQAPKGTKLPDSTSVVKQLLEIN